MTPQYTTLANDQERRIILALQAIEEGQFSSVRLAALTFEVSYRTLYYRRAGRPFRPDCPPNGKNLTLIEEQAIIRYILELGDRGFPPTKPLVREMADALLADRDQKPVGKNWVDRFIKRSEELKTCW